MKHTSILYLLLVLPFLTACGDDENKDQPGKTLPDPQGTETVYLVNDVNTTPTTLTPKACQGKIYLEKDYQLTALEGKWQFIKLTEKNSLATITEIPEQGWSKAVVAEPGQGYLAMNTTSTSVTYVRMYAEEYIHDRGGIKFKYQSPFQGKADKPQLKDTQDNNITIQAEQQELTLQLQEPISYTLETEQTWIKLTPQPGYIQLTTQENTSTLARTATITLKAEGLQTLEITLTQKGSEEPMQIKPTSFELQGEASTQTIEILFTADWKIESNADWCTFPQQQGTQEKKAEIQVEENKEGAPREAIITVSNQKGEKIEITITQQPTKYLAGEGTKENPYQIRTAYELDILREYTGEEYKDQYFQLMNDINLTEFLKDTEKGWEPIGDYDTPFWGHLLGNGHKITELWIDRPNEKYVALFNYIYGNIYQLGVETSERGITASSEAGIIARKGTSISECYTKGLIKVNDYAGGITTSGNVENSYSLVQIQNNSQRIAGISCSADYVRNCYFAGSFTQPEKADPVASFNADKNCYFDSQTTNIPGGNTTQEMKQKATYEGWDFENIWQIEEGISYPTLRCFNK